LIADLKKSKHTLTGGAQTGSVITQRQVFLALAAIFCLNLLLRVFYLRYDFVNGDEGVRALTALRLLEGARLYLDVVTDKPPGTTFFYATVFAAFGRSMAAVHLAAAVWNYATSVIIYLTGARLYGRRVGLWAALLFVYFSTNYMTQDMMAANTELLMALPYTAAFYFYVRAHPSVVETEEASRPLIVSSWVALFLAGAMAGFSTLFKQVGVLTILFFALYELLAITIARRSHGASRREWLLKALRSSLVRLLTVALGFASVIGAFLLWLYLDGALAGFWRNVVVLGGHYVDAVSAELWLGFLRRRALGYVLFNITLWSLAVWVAARALANRLGKRNRYQSDPTVTADLSIALWAAVSLSGVLVGGRFFGHYFIQVLPALALLGARGVLLLWERMRDPVRKRRAQVAAALLALTLAFSFVRFHHRTATLAYETITGKRTRWSEPWGMTKREREAEVISAFVRSRLAEGEPLYIWDYALDVYWLTGCRPASRYLAPYYITGKFPDAAMEPDAKSEQFLSEAREHFIEDLKRNRPRLILDVYGKLRELPYPEVVEFIDANYEYEGEVGPQPGRPFAVFRLIEETNEPQ
jgi:4-amino-4-deoxy-L-arabinose transferase-like glycosyltransferase